MSQKFCLIFQDYFFKFDSLAVLEFPMGKAISRWSRSVVPCRIQFGRVMPSNWEISFKSAG